VRHDSLRPAVPKDPRASRAGSFVAPVAAPSRITRSGGAPSAPATNSDILKMLWGIFTKCRRTDQRLDVMDQCLQIVRCNQEIIHSQRDEPLQEFPDVPVFPPVPNLYGSLTPTELADPEVTKVVVDPEKFVLPSPLWGFDSGSQTRS
jgi:hypothetical protein